MTVQSPDVADMIVDQAKALAEHDGVPHGLTHLIAAAEAVVAAVRREMDRLIAEFVPHGTAAPSVPVAIDLPQELAPLVPEPEPTQLDGHEDRAAPSDKAAAPPVAEVEQ